MALQNGMSQASTPLPNGGGAQEGIGSDFEVDLSTGTGSYRIPIALPPGPRQIKPSLALGYSTGYGNGLVGLGWSLPMSAITRSQTDGIPAFNDTLDSFQYGGQSLVPIGNNRYRQAVEKDFYRIERVNDGWEVRQKDGTLLTFGMTPNGQLSLPIDGPHPIFQWLLETIEDSVGNQINFSYDQDNGYIRLTEVRYGPYSVRMNYEIRPDPIISHRLGVQRIQQNRLVSITQILLEGGIERQVKSYRLTYEQAPHSGASRMVAFTTIVFDDSIDPVVEHTIPPLTFSYSDIAPEDATLQPLISRKGTLPPPVISSGLAMLDLDGSGIPGFLQISPKGGHYWPNLGKLEVGSARKLKHFPTALAERPDRVRVASLSGHGLFDLVVMSGQSGGYYALQSDGSWDLFRPFKRAPAVPILDSRTRMVDLNFNGKADLLYADDKAFYAVINRGKGDFEMPRVIKRQRDRALFPDVDFADQRIHFANMTGDGTSAIVEVRDRSVIYWPNLGYGRFGAAVTMVNPPDLPRNYDIGRIFLTDLDGDGLADFIYVDQNRVLCWFNQAGQRFSSPIIINRTPAANGSDVVLTDLCGKGNQGILWSGNLPLNGRSTHYFMDITGTKKANLLKEIQTPTGAIIRIDYDTSITESIADRGSDDQAYLPFPVQVVRRVEAEDPISNVNIATEFSYHKGYYDRRQKQFMGFGRVEKRDVGGGRMPDRVTISHYYTKPPDTATSEALLEHKILAKMPYRVEVYGADDELEAPFWTETVVGEAILIDTGINGDSVYFAARREVHRVTTDRGVRSVERLLQFEYDQFGNVIEEQETHTSRDAEDQLRTNETTIHTIYLEDNPSYLVGAPAMIYQRDNNGNLLNATRYYYDGMPFQGLPFRQSSNGVISRRESMVFTNTMLPQLYGTNIPDLDALGYTHINDPILGSGWWLTEITQEADSFGNPIERRNPLGNAQHFQFDTFGIYPIQIENELGQVATASYEYRHGQLINEVKPDGTENKWVYDVHGRLLEMIRPQDTDDNASIYYERAPFESPSRLTIHRATDGPGSAVETKHLYFDSRGQQLQSRIDLGAGRAVVTETPISFIRGMVTNNRGPYFATSTNFSLDDAPVEVTSATTIYDVLDRPLHFLGPDGMPAERRYEAGVIHHFDAEDLKITSPHFNTPRSEYFDGVGHLLSVVERLAGQPDWITQYYYNSAGLLSSISDHQGVELLNRQYDLQGRLIRLDHREAGEHYYVYDPAGRKVEERKGRKVIHRTFDVLGRINELRYGTPGSNPVETYTYDIGTGDNLVGKLARVDGDFGSVSFSYTLCGKLKSKTRTFLDRPGSHTLSYTYDRQGRARIVTYPNGHVVNLDYNQAGQPIGVSGIISDVEYDAIGYIRRLVFSNEVETNYTYTDRPGQVATLETGKSGSDSYQHFRYKYDQVGNPVTIDDLTTVAGHVRDNRSYRYDALYRLIEAEGREAIGNYHHHYNYDPLGNLIDRPEIGGGITLNYNQGRVSGSSTGYIPEYDDTGNLTKLDGWQHIYDPRGRLTESVHTDGRRVETLYDHTGSRVSVKTTQADGIIERTWYCDEASIINEDNSTETYIFFNRHPVAVLRSSGDNFIFHHDPLGQPICYSNLTNGNFSGQVVYYPFGGVAVEMGFGTFHRYRFGNHPKVGSTGLLHFGVRAYSPRLGRFMQPDPAVVFNPEKGLRLPRGLHSYVYVMNNPAALIDPYGANWFTDAIDWVGDKIGDAANAVVATASAIGNAIKDAAVAIGNFVADVATTIWDGIVAVGSAIWEGIKWAAGVVWEGIKLLGKALAFLGTWALTIIDFAITWLNPLNWIAFGLDQIDHPIADAFSFIIKFGKAPLTTTIGLIVGGIGVLTGDVDNVTFKDGMVVFEWDPSASGFSGMVWGGVAHLWSGDANDPAFEHEVYHSYQYAGWGDSFMPAYAIGGGWGLLSSAMAGDPQWDCFGGVSDGYTYGQPLEMGGELIDPSDNCH